MIDIRSSKAVPLSVSESQDDELLSCVAIKGYVGLPLPLPSVNRPVWDSPEKSRFMCADVGFTFIISSGTKVLTGSSMGILSVWDRSKGFGDCVDRIPG